jgi:hypothetical protein
MKIPKNYIRDIKYERQYRYDHPPIFPTYGNYDEYARPNRAYETMVAKVELEVLITHPEDHEFLRYMNQYHNIDMLTELEFKDKFYDIIAAGRAGLVLNLQSDDEEKRKIAKALVSLFK